jgi:hypothetical protein
VNQANRDIGLARSGRLSLDQLEAIIVRSGKAVSRGKYRGDEEHRAN